MSSFALDVGCGFRKYFGGEGGVVSTDERDFHTDRWKNQHPFRNLLLEQV